MKITLKQEQETWLKPDIAAGEFNSDDLSWAKPLVDEGQAALERGESISMEEHKARNAARLAAAM